MLASEITKKFKEQVRDESSKAFANRCRQLFTAVINTTPIDEGEASGNWQTRLTSTSKEVNRYGKEAAIAEARNVTRCSTTRNVSHASNMRRRSEERRVGKECRL